MNDNILKTFEQQNYAKLQVNKLTLAIQNTTVLAGRSRDYYIFAMDVSPQRFFLPVCTVIFYTKSGPSKARWLGEACKYIRTLSQLFPKPRVSRKFEVNKICLKSIFA